MSQPSVKVAVPYKNDISLAEEEHLLRECFNDLVAAGFPPEVIKLTSDNLELTMEGGEFSGPDER